MFTRIAAVGVLMCLVVGCAKKTAKFTGASNDSSSATPQPQPPAHDKLKPNEKGDKEKTDGKPNWLDDPRVKHDPSQLPVDAPNRPGWGSAKPPAGGWTPANGPVPQPGGGGPVAGPASGAPQPAVPPVTAPPSKPSGKPVAEADMKDVWIFIENASGASGKMPRPELVYAALVQAKSPAADLVKDGSIFLTGASARESVWAFEMKALTQGGWVASQNGVENMTAAELTRRLKAK